MTIGENIRKIRKQKGLAQKRLAELSGLNEVTIRSYELGKFKPKFETIQKIAKALDISTSELYGIEFNDKEITIVEPSLEEIMQEISDLRYSLNKEGLLKTKDYMYDLMGNPKYKTD